MLSMAEVYVAQSGDTLSEIAQRFDTTTKRLVALNGIADPDRIRVGQEILLPGMEKA